MQKIQATALSATAFLFCSFLVSAQAFPPEETPTPEYKSIGQISSDNQPFKHRSDVSFLDQFDGVEHHLIHSAIPDRYQGYQILPNGFLRIFLNTGEENYLTTPRYIDVNQNISLESLAPTMLEMQGNWYGASPGYKILPLIDGSTIVSTTQNGCDVVPMGGVLKLNPTGENEWNVEFDEWTVGEPPVDKLIFIDSNVIYTRVFNSTELFVDMDGNKLNLPSPDSTYDITTQAPYGFLAVSEDRLDLLTPGFDLLLSYQLPDTITNIQQSINGGFILYTGDSFYLMDTSKQLVNTMISFKKNDMLWASSNYYWLFQHDNHLLIKHDTLFNPIDTTSVPSSIVPRIGVSYADTMIVVASYQHPLNEGVVIFRGLEHGFHLGLERDLSVTNIEIPDSIVTGYINETLHLGWLQRYPYINVEVSNYGLDTVNEFTIQFHWPSYYFQCGLEVYRWEFDTMVPPGGNVTVSLGKFEPCCLQNNFHFICLSVIAPDGETDVQPENDDFCKPFSLLMNTEEKFSESQIRIRPNPAADQIFIENESQVSDFLMAYLISTTGQVVDKFPLLKGQMEISLLNYLPGVYYLRLEDKHGKVEMKKLVIL